MASVITEIAKLWPGQTFDFNDGPESFQRVKIVTAVTVIPETLVYLPVNPRKVGIVREFVTDVSEERQYLSALTESVKLDYLRKIFPA